MVNMKQVRKTIFAFITRINVSKKIETEKACNRMKNKIFKNVIELTIIVLD